MISALTAPSSVLLSSGWRHIAFDDVSSTNDIALEHAKSGDAGQLWITGKRQLSGRGRQGRNWVSETGNLYASALLVKKTDDLSHFATLPFVIALALADMVEDVAPSLASQIGLKWPNDILLNDAKLAGILIETAPLDAHQRAIIIGCGVNLAHAPTDTPYPATSLRAHNCIVTPSQAFEFLHDKLAHWLSAWNEGRNVAPILHAWRKRAIGIGKEITVRLPNENVQGLFADIDEAGYLILRLQSGETRRIAAGDVFFNRV